MSNNFAKLDGDSPLVAHVPNKFNLGGKIESFDLDKISMVYMACEEQKEF